MIKIIVEWKSSRHFRRFLFEFKFLDGFFSSVLQRVLFTDLFTRSKILNTLRETFLRRHAFYRGLQILSFHVQDDLVWLLNRHDYFRLSFLLLCIEKIFSDWWWCLRLISINDCFGRSIEDILSCLLLSVNGLHFDDVRCIEEELEIFLGTQWITRWC